MMTRPLLLLSLAGLMLAGAAMAQSLPPTSEELQAHNSTANQTMADRTRTQTLQMQQRLQADQVQRQYNFGPNPFAAPGTPQAVTPGVPASPRPR